MYAELVFDSTVPWPESMYTPITDAASSLAFCSRDALGDERGHACSAALPALRLREGRSQEDGQAGALLADRPRSGDRDRIRRPPSPDASSYAKRSL